MKILFHTNSDKETCIIYPGDVIDINQGETVLVYRHLPGFRNWLFRRTALDVYFNHSYKTIQ